VFKGISVLRTREAERGFVSVTVEVHEESLWLIPVSIAIAFMLWVLWHWWKEERR